MQALARKRGEKASSARSFTPILMCGSMGRRNNARPFMAQCIGAIGRLNHPPHPQRPERTHRSLLWRSASLNKFSHESETCRTPLCFLVGEERFTILSHTTLPSAAGSFVFRSGDRERGRRLLVLLLCLPLPVPAAAAAAAGEPSLLSVLLLGEGFSPSKV